MSSARSISVLWICQKPLSEAVRSSQKLLSSSISCRSIVLARIYFPTKNPLKCVLNGVWFRLRVNYKCTVVVLGGGLCGWRAQRASASSDRGRGSSGPPLEACGGMAEAAGTSRGLRVYKIVVLGDGGVGKSAVTLQFVSHSFLDYHDPTIEDSYQQQAVIDGEPALLDILDTAGQVEFTAMREQYMRCGEGFMLCYSVTDRRTFRAAAEYKRLLAQARPSERLPLVLVGNKLDLAPRFRQVTTEEGKELATQLGCPFFETSAALRHFVDDAFHGLVREIRRLERQRQASLLGSATSGGGGRRRWRRLRSIFAFVFRRRRRNTP